MFSNYPVCGMISVIGPRKDPGGERAATRSTSWSTRGAHQVHWLQTNMIWQSREVIAAPGEFAARAGREADGLPPEDGRSDHGRSLTAGHRRVRRARRGRTRETAGSCRARAATRSCLSWCSGASRSESASTPDRSLRAMAGGTPGSSGGVAQRHTRYGSGRAHALAHARRTSAAPGRRRGREGLLLPPQEYRGSTAVGRVTSTWSPAPCVAHRFGPQSRVKRGGMTHPHRSYVRHDECDRVTVLFVHTWLIGARPPSAAAVGELSRVTPSTHG